MGDEYFANLDHIESVEAFKEGYESEAHCSDSEGSGVDMSRVKLNATPTLQTKASIKNEDSSSGNGGKGEGSRKGRVITSSSMMSFPPLRRQLTLDSCLEA